MNYLFDGLFENADSQATFASAPAENIKLSYQDLIDGTAQYATALVSLGVQPGDRIAVQVPKSLSAIMLYLGCVRAGAIFLPLNSAYTSEEVKYFINDADPRVVVCDQRMVPVYRDDPVFSKAKILSLGQVSDGSLAELAASSPASFETVERGADDLAAILYTSGTTGRAKGAMLSHENLLSNTLMLTKEWRFTSEDVLLHALPIFHTHGLFVATNIILNAGGSLIFLPKFDAEEIIHYLPEATSMMGVPTFYTRLLNHQKFTAEKTKHMRLFTSGSAPLLAETHKEFEARTGHRILERYGMTETNMNTSNPYDGERRAGTVGFPLPDVSLRITEPESGNPLANGEVGMIEVKGPNVFKGYWQMPEKTASEFRKDGFFITGDLGTIDEEGYVTIIGRGKDLIISGGLNVYPKEVETLLDEMTGVKESAVIGVPHPDFGEAVVAVIVAKEKADLNEQCLKREVTVKLAKFKQPKQYFIIDELPRNALGKVQKNLLRDTYSGIFQG